MGQHTTQHSKSTLMILLWWSRTQMLDGPPYHVERHYSWSSSQTPSCCRHVSHILALESSESHRMTPECGCRGTCQVLEAAEPFVHQAPAGVDDYWEKFCCPPPNCRQDERGDSTHLVSTRSLGVNTTGIGSTGGAVGVGRFILLFFTVSLQARYHSPMLDRQLASFSIRHPDKVRNRSGRRRRRVTEGAGMAECPDSQRVSPDPPGSIKPGAFLNSCTGSAGECHRKACHFFHSCAVVEFLHSLLFPTFTFGDVIIAELPARGVGLSKILGSSLTPRIFGLGVGCVGSFCLPCCRLWCKCC